MHGYFGGLAVKSPVSWLIICDLSEAKLSKKYLADITLYSLL